MLAIILIIVVFGGVLVVFAAVKPDAYRVTRKMAIKAPAEKIFPLINDFAKWQQWSPYEKLDTSMDKTFSDKTEGTGAMYAWEGNDRAGAGQMEITASEFPTRIEIDLQMLRPIEANNIVEFKLDPVDGYTNVIWSMFGRRGLRDKIFSMFANVDEMIGRPFEEGLENLSGIVEK